MGYKLQDIKLGEVDGKRERMALPNFDEFYYDYNGIIKKALNPLNFVVAGKKGSGKTLLAEYLKKYFSKNDLHFLSMQSYKSFSLNELKVLKKGEFISEEYKPIWKWIILIELSKLCLQNTFLESEKEYEFLNNFLKDNGLLGLESFETIECVKEKSGIFNISKFFSGKAKVEKKQQQKNYFELLSPLENLILNLLKKDTRGTKYYLLFDELDEKFDGSDSYANTIICLLKVAEEINFNFSDKFIDFKVMIFLRTDILNNLTYPDLNKIKEGSTIHLNWGNKTERNSPLLKLLTKKISQSIKEMNDYDHNKILTTIFDSKSIKLSNGNRLSLDKYILSKTFFRPRDIISFIKKIINKNPDAKKINAQMVYNAEKGYSDYLAGEINDELVGHLTREEIRIIFLILREFGKTSFKFQTLKNYIEIHKDKYKKINLKKILSNLYLVGAIGNKKYNAKTKKSYFSWSFKEESILNFDDNICIHVGLRKFLNLY